MRAHSEVVDAEIREAMLRSALGLDLDRVDEAVRDGVEAIAKQMAVLKGADYAAKEYPAVAKAMSHVIKGLDELVRLVQFARGAPDSRPGEVGRDVLGALTGEQLAQLERWVREAEARGER